MSKIISSIIAIALIILILGGASYQYLRVVKLHEEANKASNEFVNSCMQELPYGSYTCDKDLQAAKDRACQSDFLKTLFMINQEDICLDGKVEKYYQIRSQY